MKRRWFFEGMTGFEGTLVPTSNPTDVGLAG